MSDETEPGAEQGLPASSERGWTKDQMVACEKCARANPPTRVACLYCGAALPVAAGADLWRKPELRPLESWERGYNVILAPLAGTPETPLAEIAGYLQLEEPVLEMIARAGVALPVARTALAEEALLVQRRLSGLGLKALVVSDDELLAQDAAPARRVRRLLFTETDLIANSTGENAEQSTRWADVLLLVAGRIVVRRLEVEEKHSRGRAREILDERELGADKAVLNIYSANQQWWQITSDNFDFSCLGEEKSLLAADNFARLIAALCRRAPRAVYDDSYQRVRPLLTVVWPLERHTESSGWRRSRRGISTENVTTISNEAQFARYSRLVYRLLLGGRA